MTTYYNEIDPYAAQWLRNLISAGLIADGEVDERSILDVRPDDIRTFTQCHFFAGIGVWSHALRLADWPDDRPVWTGSCPCQPFSVAGKGEGTNDERHLWPVWFDLIRAVQPPVIFGEQVAAAIGHSWLDTVQTDLETQGYATGAAVLGAHSVGAPHIRQRLYFVANNNNTGSQGHWRSVELHAAEGRKDASRHSSESCMVSGLAEDTKCIGRRWWSDGNNRRLFWEIQAKRLGAHSEYENTSPTNGHWRDSDWLFCRDGKWRPVEPGTFPLADRPSSRVGRLRAYGNAIVPQVAAEVIKAFMDLRP